MTIRIALNFMLDDGGHATVFPTIEGERADQSATITSREDFEAFRECRNLSNISRSVRIVDSRETAAVMACAFSDQEKGFVITRLADDVWAVSSVSSEGSYDSGEPLIEDLRPTADPAIEVANGWLPVYASSPGDDLREIAVGPSREPTP
ncbi:MAG: hypothetical protein DI629_20830 [Mesorhizobium amorphae]|nr:MAG: hypothetical protein DI629_20830 [Mesorhizobium amorphae]